MSHIAAGYSYNAQGQPEVENAKMAAPEQACTECVKIHKPCKILLRAAVGGGTPEWSGEGVMWRCREFERR